MIGSSKFRFSYYVTGILILLGVLLGRFICGFSARLAGCRIFCIRFPLKLSTRRLKPLRYIKYAVLLIMVITSGCYCQHIRHGDPFFCKYLCPQGVLEERNSAFSYKRGHTSCFGKAVQLEILHSAGSCGRQRGFTARSANGCALGAVYALMNHVSLFQMRVDRDTCVSCGACAKACPMDVDITKTPNHPECIRCGKVYKVLSDQSDLLSVRFRRQVKTEIKEN